MNPVNFVPKLGRFRVPNGTPTVATRDGLEDGLPVERRVLTQSLRCRRPWQDRSPSRSCFGCRMPCDGPFAPSTTHPRTAKLTP
jgi:hypothetical protein